jgi:serine/threonine protein kinase
MKLVLRDRVSTVDRLKKEYKTLLQIPDHPNVVKVIDADFIPGGPPFIVFEFIDGFDVGEMIENNALTREDALELGRHVACGLEHLHEHGVFHCDIKPRNLLWTGRGTKIIDFNVSVAAKDEEHRGGGSRRYLPPDLDLDAIPSASDLADRDLYALGLTLYEAVTGRYP